MHVFCQKSNQRVLLREETSIEAVRAERSEAEGEFYCQWRRQLSTKW